MTQTRLRPGEAATITFTLRNVSSQTITLQFGSTCHILPYVTDRRTQQIVHPEGGAWICALMLTSLVLAPGETIVREIQVRATGAAAAPFVALPPGDYETYAELADTVFRLRSVSLQFSVQ